jgi:Tfp pilus assembly protein PilP
MSLLGTGTEPRLSTNRAAGPAGFAVGDISLRGIVQGPNGLVALVQGPDNKTFVVHQGEKFLDGTVKAVTPQGLVIVQEVTDPLSLVKQREIRKQLRSAEGATP